MRSFPWIVCAVAVGSELWIGQTLAQTVGTAFTYQGELINGGVPVDETCDFSFDLFDVPTDGAPIAGPEMQTNVTVDDGVFSVVLDFGQAVFDGNARWLEITVTCPSISVTPTLLAPRQEIRPVPYALALPAMRVTQQGPDPVMTDCPDSLLFHGPNVIGGWRGNIVNPDRPGATIAGGGAWSV